MPAKFCEFQPQILLLKFIYKYFLSVSGKIFTAIGLIIKLREDEAAEEHKSNNF